MNGANLSQGACVCEDERQDYLRKCALRSVDVDSGERIVKCHASMDDVIDVRIVECHASIHVVIGIRVVLCHPLVHNFGFLLRVQIIILLSCCNNSAS